MDDLHKRLEHSILVELADTANTQLHEMFAQLVMCAAQSIEKFNSRIMLFKKLTLLPDLVVELEPYTGINIGDINRWAQWDQTMPLKPIEILTLDRLLRQFFCPEHQTHKSNVIKHAGKGCMSLAGNIAIRDLEKIIYQQECIIDILKARLLKLTLMKD